MKNVKRSIYPLFFLCLSFPMILSAHKYENIPDSLNAYLKQQNNNDSVKTEALISVIDILMDAREYEIISELSEELIALSEQTNYGYGMAIGNYFFSAHYLYADDFSACVEHLSQSFNHANNLPNSYEKQILILRIHIAYSAYYHRISMLPEALDHVHKAMAINDSLNILKYTVVCANNMAGIYADIGNTRQSIKILNPILENGAIVAADKFLISSNLGILYLRVNQPDSALFLFNEAMHYAKTNNEQMLLLYYIGSTYLRKKELEKALEYYNKSIQVPNALNYPNNYAINAIQMASTYHLLKDYKSALTYVDIGIEKSTSLSIKCMGMYTKAEILKQLNRYKDCASVLLEYITLNDSLITIKDVSKTSQMLFEYELKQQQMNAEIQHYIMQAKHDRQRNRLMLITISAIMGIIIVLLLLNRKNILLKGKKEQEQSLKNQLELKNKELASNVMTQINKNKLVEETIKIVADLNVKEGVDEADLKRIVKKMRRLKTNNSWNEFDYGFIQIHQSFYDKLSKEFPDITLNERRLCALLKLNLNTKEIASITNSNPDSVRVARTRLRKKLGLTNSELSLTDFLSNY